MAIDEGRKEEWNQKAWMKLNQDWINVDEIEVINAWMKVVEWAILISEWYLMKARKNVMSECE